jgi:site-specific DNA-cytosine methylase
VANVLIACEFSGIVREAFYKQHHRVVSCDLLPTEIPGPHYEGDVSKILDEGFDLMIAFPPCTHLAVSGARWFKDKQREQAEALEFIQLLMDAPIPHIAIENPVGIISTQIRKPDQIIQPWQFGHPESKKTCLWLKMLPQLQPTNVLDIPECGYWQNQTPSGQNKLGPSENRWKERSKTYQGIADAMADQWGSYVNQLNNE